MGSRCAVARGSAGSVSVRCAIGITYRVRPVPDSREQSSAKAVFLRPRVALAHDWLCGYRGGEGVLDAILRALEPWAVVSALYVMFDDRRPLTPAIDRVPHATSWLNALPAAHRLRRWCLPLYPMGVRHLSKQLARDHPGEPIDLLVSTSSAAVKGITAPPGVPHVCYIHAPARYLWSRTGDYEQGSPLRAAGLRLLGPALRRWDAASAKNVERFIANSTHTQAQVARCYGREACVVHPPVRTGFFTPDAATKRDDAWLVVSALEPYKRVDAAIAAARAAGARLRIAGAGSQRASLESLAGNGVELLGRVSDERLRDLYRSSRVLIFPQVEDFGIVAAEALACGLPVVARRDGGALDIVQEGVTGAFFDSPEPRAIIEAVGRCPRHADEACRMAALRFADERFIDGMNAILREALPRA